MITVSIDQSQFQAAFRQIMANTPRTLSEELNTRMFYIARGASRLTPVSQKLEHDLGITAYTFKKSRKGGTKKGKAIFSINTGNRFAAIINARRARAGESALPKTSMADEIKKLIAARLRSKGTEKAGWLAGIRKLGSIIGQPSFSQDSRVKITNTSLVVAAKESWNPEVSLEYRVISTDTNRHQYIDPKTQDALQRAFDDEVTSMRAKIEQRLQRDFDKVNAK